MLMVIKFFLLLSLLRFGELQSCNNGSLRLSPSGNSYGAVEVCLNNSWGSVCSDFWDNNDASVVCNQLGYSPYGAIGSAVSYRYSSLQVHNIIDLHCTGNETTISDCSYNGLTDYSCSLNRDANVFCQSLSAATKSDCIEGDVRLIGGTTQYEGRVEVCVNQAWGTVCFFSGRYNAAKVVCRQVGALPIGFMSDHVGNLGYAQGSGPIILGYFSCSGQESNLLSCSQNYFDTYAANSVCRSHYWDGAVICQSPCVNGTIRLSGGSNSFGRVEICVNGSWGTICSDYWDYEDASVVCRLLGHSPYGAIPMHGYFINHDWPFLIIDLNCTGSENSLWNCSSNELMGIHTCPPSHDAEVICQAGDVNPVYCTTGNVRLIGGNLLNEGRLEVCVNNVWGTVCSNSWTSQDTRVACRQLGHQEYGGLFGSGWFGQGTGPVVFGSMHCTGSESSLFECQRNIISVASGSCFNHSNDLGLRCVPLCENGVARIRGGPSSSTGRVEICVNRTWGTICTDYWDHTDASVLCLQLGYSPYGAIAGPNLWSESILPQHIAILSCSGNESNVLNCTHSNSYSCPSNRDASISCQSISNTPMADCIDGEVRLVGGNTQYEGRVEVCINKVWGTVCARDHHDSNRWSSWLWRWSWYRNRMNAWDYADSNVVCRQVGHVDFGSTPIRQFGQQGSGPIFMYDVHCNGGESNLLQCSHRLMPPSFCSHSYDVGVICEAHCENGTVRLYSESGSYFRRYGRVQVCVNNIWGTICDDYWDDHDATVVCRMLGYSPIGATALTGTFTESTWPSHINDLNCKGNESSIWDCPMNELSVSCYYQDDAAVVCQRPGIVQSACTTGNIRLTNNLTQYEGRVEICANGVWGSVCDYGWDSRDAYVVCRELGHQGNVPVHNSYFGVGTKPILIYQAYCDLPYTSLHRCHHRRTPDYACNNYQEAGVRCEAPCTHGKVDLFNGPSDRFGIVRVCVNGKWSRICGNRNTLVDNNMASVICSELGFSPYGAKSIRGIWNDYTYPFILSNVRCDGTESSILDCYHTTTESCFHDMYRSNVAVSILCQKNNIVAPVNCTDGDIRLYGGSHRKQGTLQICSNQAWVTVCSNNYWNSENTNVVCYQMDHITYGNSYSARDTSDEYPIAFNDFDCFGNEIRLSACGSGISSDIQYCLYKAIEITCGDHCNYGDIRLAGGSYYYGRVELCYEGVWGTVCRDSQWDNTDASVVCQQLGFSPYGALAVTDSWLYEREKINFITGVNCLGSEDNIFDCPTEPQILCPSTADANVVCSVHGSNYSNCTDGEVRLFGGRTDYEGTVEVCNNNAWGTFVPYYNNYYNSYTAQTICNSLGYTGLGAIYFYNAYFGEGSGPIVMSGYCTSIQLSILDCRIRYEVIPSRSHSNDFGVRCQPLCESGDIRLEGSNNILVGRVEICLFSTWGTVCDDYWDDNDASVVCRQLGFPSEGARARAGLYHENLKSFHIIDLNCVGAEDAVFNCSYNTVEQHNCNSHEDAYVVCPVPDTSDNCTDGEIELSGGQSQNEGLVVMCYDGAWKSICPSFWGTSDAQVVCRQLGYSSIGAIVSNTFGQSFGLVHLLQFYCSGNESNLINCTYYTNLCPSYLHHAGVICEELCAEGGVRLKGDSKYNNFGRVEVCINGTWGTVCSNDWDNTDASVLCRELGFSPYGAISQINYYSSMQLSHYFFDIECSGDEDTLFDCSYVTNGSLCNYDENAGAVCQSIDVVPTNCTDYDVQLVDGTASEGKLLICLNGIWGTVCNNQINYADVTLICQKVGYDTGGETYYVNSPNSADDPILITDIYCTEYAASLDQCSLTIFTKLSTCDVRHTVGIKCHNCTDGDMRLIPYSSFSDLVGRIEVCVDGSWGTVCSQYFTDRDAQVVCRQLGHTALGSISMSNRHNENYLPHHIINPNCAGTEDNLWNCSSDIEGQELCQVTHDVSVACHDYEVEYSNCTDGQLRISNETDTLQGRVELCYGNTWFGICADNYNNHYYTQIVCKQLGYPLGGSGYSSSFLDLPDLPLFPFEFSCNSNDDTVLGCSRNVINCYSSSQNSFKFSGVICYETPPPPEECQHEQIRLTGTGYETTGSVEVCINGTWGTICPLNFDNNDANVVCAHLGYTPYGSVVLPSMQASGLLVHVQDLNCTGTEFDIWDCAHNNTQYCSMDYNYKAAVLCQHNNSTIDTSCTTGDVRLMDGINEYEGRVEMCYNQMWTTICHHSWDTSDANVVCKQLGYPPSGATSLSQSYFGSSSNPYLASSFHCSNSDDSLINCDKDFSYLYATHFCGDDTGASLACLDPCNNTEVRLSGTLMGNIGRVELCVGVVWTTLCDRNWDQQDARVVCRELGYLPYGAIPTYGCYTEGHFSFGIIDLKCNGTEDRLVNCSHSNPVLHNCGSHKDAGLICQTSVVQANCTDGEVRLVEGSVPHEGRVEVCFNEAWGTVCSSSWSNNDGNVICKQLGYLPLGAKVKHHSYYGRGNGPILLSDLWCTGSEQSLLECDRYYCGVTSCSHFNDAGVKCEPECNNGTVRLGDEAELRGRVEVCINSIWTTICSHHWTINEATVVCSELGYSSYGALSGSGLYTVSEWSIGIYELECVGNESSIWDCQYQTNHTEHVCSQYSVASVFCMPNTTEYVNCTDGDVRLVGGFTENEGNVQICYRNTWTSVYGGSWGASMSNVVCRQLGLQPYGSQYYYHNYFGVVDNPPFVYSIYICSGTEQSILDCLWYIMFGSQYIYESKNVAGARCIGVCTDGNVRLRESGYYHLIGEVEVCVNGTWSTICDEHWDDKDASVVCSQLGYSLYGAMAAYGSLIVNVYPMRIYDVNCSGNEDSLMKCFLSITPQEVQHEQCSRNNAGVICQDYQIPFANCTNGDIRLIGGYTKNEGKIEICINNVWGTVCTDNWTETQSNLVCRQLGYQAFGSISMSFSGLSNLPVMLAGLQCTGSESTLLGCSRSLYGLLNCYHHDLAGVQCEELCTDGDIRIVGETSESLYGRVDVCVNQTWGTICDSRISETVASVLCDELGFSPYGAIAATGRSRYNTTSIPVNINSVNCSGEENALSNCSIVYSDLSCNSADAEIVCQESDDVTVSDCTTGEIKLVGRSSNSPNEGTVEVCINRVWGTVCDDGWSENDANVVCEQLGFYPFEAIPRYGSFYGEGGGPVFLSHVHCTDSNNKLLDCERDTYAAKSCNHFQDAGVKCHGSFPVHASRSVGKVYGGEQLLITGPTFNPDNAITCMFADIPTTGHYINSTSCLCIAPERYIDGLVKLEIRIQSGNAVLSGATKYRYTTPFASYTTEDVHVNQDQTILKTEEEVTVTWSPSDLTENLPLQENTYVDIAMYIYNPNAEEWEDSAVLLTGIPNTGEAIITVPDYQNVVQDSIRLALIKVSLSVTGNQQQKRMPQSSSFSKISRFGLKLLVKRTTTEIAKRIFCNSWHSNTRGINADRLPPCPCNTEQMSIDDRYTKEKPFQFYISKFFFKKSRASSCYRQTNIRTQSQQCCYDANGQLLTGIGGGTAYSVYPSDWNSVNGHVTDDMLPFYLCCWGFFKSCNYYYDRRPNDDCSDWPRRPPPARFHGDPHLVTLDGYKYTFNGHGEFTMIESLDEFLTVQVRMTEPQVTNFGNESNRTSAGGTAITAIVAKHQYSDTVQFEVLSEDNIIALINGDSVDFSELSEQQFQNVTVTDRGNGTLIASLSTGVTITVKERNGILSDVSVTLSDEYYNNIRGLLGQFNGDEEDDLYPKNDSISLASNSSLKEIHAQFGLSWIIDDRDESLFTYGTSGSWNTFYKPNYMPLFEPTFSDPELEQEALEICGDDQLCLFDIAATGNTAIGEATKESGEDLEMFTQILQPNICDPPCAHGACVSNNTCFCSEGYEGSSCNKTISNDCEENICLNGGTCQVIVGDYVCYCASEYEGAICENGPSPPIGTDVTSESPTISSPSMPPSNSIDFVTIIVSSVALLLLCTAVLVIVTVFCYMKMKQNVKVKDISEDRIQYSLDPPVNFDDENNPEAYELSWVNN